ncbi:B3 domain-containing protein Os01g0723500-like isoform X2 [Mangifera indica]|uniref:B3 domain-containing protein Os01g0723500-like isoform X2 n=1 Tax=Mangifera indica TaxID=29780 RepID=UPI001CFB3861|nr:B3 domain-containing protein Os01g0723500-like isoform X2 [Mangifera indica]XP_044511040.1 B3 domain-containing protein Os01g0723500-like isoform X2 [Mangifera indica]
MPVAVNMKQKPSFFNVLIGDFSKQLPIPPAFLKYFKGNSVGNCVLRSPTGKFWCVKMEKNVSGTCFGSGWLDFVKDHSLEVGDFMVFKYYGKSMFTVKIYDKTNCEKDIGPAKMNNDNPNSCSGNGNQNQARDKIEDSNPLVFKAGTERKPITSVQGSYLRPRKKPVVQVDKQTTKATLPFKSENFCFRSTWTGSHKYNMTIPSEAVREKNLMTKKMVMLLDPNGRSWPVKLYPARDGRLYLSKGWFDFCRGNKIATGDTLVFEITQETAMQVHVFRAKEKAVPFQSRVFYPVKVKKIEPE